jgi:hypothetical protein
LALSVRGQEGHDQHTHDDQSGQKTSLRTNVGFHVFLSILQQQFAGGVFGTPHQIIGFEKDTPWISSLMVSVPE